MISDTLLLQTGIFQLNLIWLYLYSVCYHHNSLQTLYRMLTLRQGTETRIFMTELK